MKTYPAGKITKNQSRRLIEGKEPAISYVAYDGSATFHLMGPLSPVAGVQSGVTITRDSIKGLMPSWQMLDQVGANQDGVTFNDAVYGPAEIDMVVEAQGLNPADTRTVVRDWISSWDAHQQGELQAFTLEQGLWWAPARLLKAPPDALSRAQSNRQRFVWTARIDDAFWRSYDSTGAFSFDYGSMIDRFDYTAGSATATSLGTNWPLYYAGTGGGYIVSRAGQARWRDDPTSPFFTATRSVVVGPYKDFNTATDSQVVNIILGTFPEISFPRSAYNDLWGRMGRNADGTWNGYGVRLRFGGGYLELSRFNNFTKTIMHSRVLLLQPFMGERWTLVCGAEGNDRFYKVLRNGVSVATHKETGTGSALGPAVPSSSGADKYGFRGIGFGMMAQSAIISQATPGNLRSITAGDNGNVSQQGYITLTNIGDIEAWPRYLLYGPGYFSIGNGPDSMDHVEFGPLLDGQVVLIETEPRRRSVIDLTPTTVDTTQDLTRFQKFVKALVTFAANYNVPPLLQQFESNFGILPPQGVMYSLMSGRFSNPVPAKSPGSEAVTSHISIKIDNGNANSRVVAALTPRRRWPL